MMDADLARSFPEVPEIADHHDYWYSLVAATHNGVHRIEIPLAKYRQHESNMVGIASIRSLQGWANSSSSSSMRERVVRRALFAQHVGKTLPVSFLRRLLYRNKMGWALSLLIVIAQRSFSNQHIVNVARRHFFELVFFFPSQRGNILHLRNKIPLQGNLKHLFAIFFSVAAATLLFATNNLGGRIFTLGFSLALGSVACLALSLLRIFQHQVPKTGVVALGVGCALAWSLSAFFGEPIVSVMALALPLLAYASYRLHWRRHTGF